MQQGPELTSLGPEKVRHLCPRAWESGEAVLGEEAVHSPSPEGRIQSARSQLLVWSASCPPRRAEVVPGIHGSFPSPGQAAQTSPCSHGLPATG